MGLNQIYTEELIQFVQDHLTDDPAHLLLSYTGKVNFDLRFAVQQIQARQKARAKLPAWCQNPKLIFPPTLALEQASSEDTARFKADLVIGDKLLDLTGGFGVDTYFLAKNFKKAIYLERNQDLKEIASYNFNVLEAEKFETVAADSLAFLKTTSLDFDLIFVDPARRGNHNEKLFKLAECEPDVVENWELLTSKTSEILVKASPMLDLKQAWQEVPAIQKTFVVAVKNEVKEVLLSWKKNDASPLKIIACVNLHPSGNQYFEFDFEEEEDTISQFGNVDKYLIEPNAAILKAGGFKSFGNRFGLKKLHPNSHLFTTAQLPSDIPGRVFEVIQVVSQPKKELNKLVPDGFVNVITRNYAISTESLKKKYKLKDGGNSFLIGTKTQSGFILLLCKVL